ncbi:MAG: cytochrome b N-terminal domain-containing protein [Nitrospinae bacterium]|nr:cytochrome b N-terminal domain-containing protein [Nitrospinota bacterium]
MMGAFIDWLDVRLDVRRLYREQCAFEMPEGFSFWRIFGALTIGCVAIQVVTGVYMLAYYVPVPDMAHQSIRNMCNSSELGALMRNMHRWSSTLAILFVLVHATHVVARRAYRAPRELTWWTGLTLGVIFALLLITGVIMPWDWRSYWELVIWADWVDVIPVVGEQLKGPLLAWYNLGRNFAMHIYILPALLGVALAVHIYLIRRLGLSDRV